jgi:hypothetical protein
MNKKLLSLFAIIAVSFSLIAQSTNPAPYCNASFDDQQGFPVDDHIDKVSFGTLSNSSNAQYAAPHYVFYNNLATANFTKGSSYTLKVKFTVAGGAGYGVWIDYNHNNTFDSNEKVAGTTGTNFLALQSDSISVSVSIPTTATPGNTRMRVRIVEDDNYHIAHGTAELACNTDTSAANVMDWGETEDYTINIATATGIDEKENINSITLYPNPVHDLIKLNVPDNSSRYTYSIVSMIGQSLEVNTVLNQRQTIDISGLSEGLYLLKLTDSYSNTEKVLKFEKQKE